MELRFWADGLVCRTNYFYAKATLGRASIGWAFDQTRGVGAGRRGTHNGIGGVRGTAAARQLVGNEFDLREKLEDGSEIWIECGARVDSSTLCDKNFITGRYEWSQRDELLADNPALAERRARWFDVNAYTIGYTRNLFTFHGAETGLGANVSLYGIPDGIKPYYGNHPMSVNVYQRVRLR